MGEFCMNGDDTKQLFLMIEDIRKTTIDTKIAQEGIKADMAFIKERLHENKERIDYYKNKLERTIDENRKEHELINANVIKISVGISTAVAVVSVIAKIIGIL